jgi:membrane fusion protein (multidrug efflux system)
MADETPRPEDLGPPAPADEAGGKETLLLRHVLWRGLIVLVLLGILGFAAFYLTRAGHGPAPRSAPPPSGPLAVNIITVEPKDVPITVEYLGHTEASETVPIRARVNGVLMERGFEEGQLVTEGQVLFRIDPKPFEVALRRAEAGLQSAQAVLTRAQRQVRRFEELAAQQQAAANELEQAQEALGVAAAAVETQRALIEQAKLDLGYTTIAAPITGVIGMRQQDVGSFVGPEAEPLLATMRKVDPLYVRFSVSERDLLRWQRMTEQGMVGDVGVEDLTVTVVLPDGREFPHPGRINFVDVAVDPSTGTAVVRSSVPNPDRALLPGQFVHARIGGVSRLGALAVPQSAVLQTPAGASVYVADGGVAHIRPVTTGAWSSGEWIIESGLRSGDRVITDHLVQVRPGTPVEAAVSPGAPGPMK